MINGIIPTDIIPVGSIPIGIMPPGNIPTGIKLDRGAIESDGHTSY